MNGISKLKPILLSISKLILSRTSVICIMWVYIYRHMKWAHRSLLAGATIQSIRRPRDLLVLRRGARGGSAAGAAGEIRAAWRSKCRQSRSGGQADLVTPLAGAAQVTISYPDFCSWCELGSRASSLGPPTRSLGQAKCLPVHGRRKSGCRPSNLP